MSCKNVFFLLYQFNLLLHISAQAQYKIHYVHISLCECPKRFKIDPPPPPEMNPRIRHWQISDNKNQSQTYRGFRSDVLRETFAGTTGAIKACVADTTREPSLHGLESVDITRLRNVIAPRVYTEHDVHNRVRPSSPRRLSSCEMCVSEQWAAIIRSTTGRAAAARRHR